MKKANHYQLTLKQLSCINESHKVEKPLSIKVENHDEIFQIIQRVKDKGIFESENEVIEFTIGLKLFTEVMLKNRKNDLFNELGPEMKNFMKKLKNS